MRIFITGCNGFLGKYLVDRLLPHGHEIHGLFMGEEQPNDKAITYHRGDLLDYETIGRIVHEVDPEIIIHLAARTEVEKSFYDPIKFSEINYCGTVNLIEKSRDLQNLKLFLFSSTMETYGIQPKPWSAFDEETEQHPNAPYAVAKRACELYLEYAGRSYGLPYCILRQTNTYGRWDNDFFVVEQIITQMLKNPKTISLGYKEPYRNFLYIDDLIDLYEVIVNNIDAAKDGAVFCTGPENALTIGALAEIIAGKLGWTGDIQWNTKPKRVGEIYYLNSKTNRAKTYLGWSPKTDLATGLDKTILLWRK